MKQYRSQALIPLVEKMIKGGQLRRTLYTYMSVELFEERVKPVLEDCKLWFSSPAYFNDPFDCKIYPHIPSDEVNCTPKVGLVINKGAITRQI